MAEPTHDPGSDQAPVEFGYGHGRMPLFLKLFWVGFLVFATWYVVQFLLTALGREVSG
jgi:hypothetical protein